MKKLYRSKNNKLLAGLCGGLGEYLRIDPILIRFFTIIALIFTGFFPVFIAYIIGWWIVPIKSKSSVIPVEKCLYRSYRDRKIAGICGGLGEYWHFDPTIIRIIVVFLCIITAVLPLMIAYLIGWIIIPLRPSNDYIEIISEREK